MKKLYLLKFLSIFCFIILYTEVVRAQINTPAGAVVPFGANQGYAHGIMPTNLPTGGTYGKSQHAAEAYNEWKQQYVAACPNGRFRVKFDDPNRVVSEGIAYGMLLSVYAADKALFDGLWAYYKDNSNGNGVMNWLIEGCNTVRGANGATDAEFDAAMALLLAKNQWPNATSPYNYGDEATRLIDAIWRTEMDHQRFQAKNGDAWGWSSCRNPGYQSPAYYREYAKHVPSMATNWTNCINGAYTLINKNAHTTTGLVSDWSNEEGVMNTCNGGYLGYGYDACRFPWRMAQEVLWNNEARAKTLCEKLTDYCKREGAGNLRGPRNLDGSGAGAHNATFVSTYAFAVMGTGTANQDFMNSMYNEVRFTKDAMNNFQPSGYFGNTLRVMSLFMMTGNFWKLGTTSFQDINVRVGTTDIASGGEFDFQNVIRSGSREVTFTIENKGAETLTLSGTPRIAISGTDAANFTISQTAVPATLGRNVSANFTITFNPNNTTGTKSAVITIANNDPDASESPYTFTVTGTGTLTATSPKVTVLAAGTTIANNGTYAMGTGATGAGSPNSHRFEIKNTGDAPLNITDITATTGYTVQLPKPTVVAIGESEFIFVSATSTTAGNTTGSFTIVSDDASSPNYRVNLSATFVACGDAIRINQVLQDFDANSANTSLSYAITGWSTVTNPHIDIKNPSYRTAAFARPATGDYVGPRYQLCGTNTLTVTAENPMISMLVYSPVAGTPVLMNLKTPADVADTETYPATSSVTVNTTKTGQWERLYFNHSAAIGATGIRFVEIYIDPLVTQGAQTYYVDDIKLDVAPCLADIPASGVLQDYDNHRNMSLPWAPPGTFNEVFANPYVDNLNPSATVAQYVRPVGEYQIIRYATCGTHLDLSEKSFISMLVYSSRAGVPITMSLKNSATAAEPLEVAFFTTMTTKAGQWERLYFDFSSVKTNTTVKALDIFIDPDGLYTNTVASRTYYIDDIQYAEGLPCVTQIQSTRILNDFDDNRYVTLAFNPIGTFDEFATNTVTTGNNSTGCASYVRPATATADVIRYQACGPSFDLSAGRSIFSVQILSPNAGTEVIFSLKKADGETELVHAYATMSKTNVWETLNFDFTEVINSTEAAFIDIIIDPNGTYTATAAQRSYRIDNLTYSMEPEIHVKRGNINIATGDLVMFDNVAAGESSESITLTINNNGSEDLILSGTPKINITGDDAEHFTVNQELISSPIALGRATSFAVSFTPLSGGLKSAAIEIANNDSDENPYYINLQGLATASEINIQAGTESIPSAGSFDFGSQDVSTTGTAVAFTIENTGTSALLLTGTPIVSISGDAADDFIVIQTTTAATVEASETTTFTVAFKPSAPGVRTAEISIENNDLNENPYVISLTGTGVELNAEISVKQGATVIAQEGRYLFDNVMAGSSGTAITFTIENNGNAPLSLNGTPIISVSGANADDFVVNQTTTEASVAAGGTTSFSITFNPAEEGDKVALISIANNTEDSPYVFTISGTAVSVELPEISVQVGNTNIASEGSYLFSNTLTGASSAAVTFTVANRGTAALELSGDPIVEISGANATDFVVNTTSTSNSVEPGATTTFTVTFSPSAAGEREAVLFITSNDAEVNPYIINLSGTGLAPVAGIRLNVVHESTSNHGSVTVGSNGAAVVYTVSSIGTGTLELTGTPLVSVTGANAEDFVVDLSNTTASIEPNGTTSFSVVFNPSAEGIRTAALTILSNDPSRGEYIVNLTGTGTTVPTPNISLNISAGETSSFGSVPSGSDSEVITYTISNTGTAVLNITGVAISGTSAADFIIVQNPATSVAAGASTTFSVVFRPSAEGIKEAVLTVSSDDPETPAYAFNLTGTATEALSGSISMNIPAGGTHNFNDVNVGSESSIVTFTISNNGSALLNITGASVTGTNAADFIILQEPATTVAVNGSTTLSMIFSPSAEGVRSAVLTVRSDDPNLDVYTINLTGTGVEDNQTVPGGTITLDVPSGGTSSFGTAESGTEGQIVTYTITNTGTTPLYINETFITGTNASDFVIISEPASPLAVNGTTTITVAFNPTAEGTRNAVLNIASSDPALSNYVVNLTGTATAPVVNEPRISLNIQAGGSYAFGNVIVGEESLATFTVSNTGTAPLSITSVAISGTSDFGIVQTPANTVAAGGSTTITVVFKPSVAGPSTATLTVSSNDPNRANYNISLSGTGVEEDVSQPGGTITLNVPSGSTSSFGTAESGTEGQVVTYTITNTGTTPLSISETFITGTNASDYVIISEPASPLAVNGTTTITVAFNPTAEGTRNAVLNITSSDPALSNYVVNLTGTATAPVASEPRISLNIQAGGSHSFGNVTVGGQSTVATFTVSNTGTAPLSITSVAISGTSDFEIVQTPANTVAAGGSTTFTVVFKPSVAGSRTATLTVGSNDPNRANYNITLSGTGISDNTVPGGSISLNVPNGEVSDFGTVTIGQSGELTYTITNNGTTPLTLTGDPLVVISRYNAEFFSVIEYPASVIPAGGSTSFTVAFNPTATNSGTYYTELTIVSSDPNVGTYTILLTGSSTVTSINSGVLAAEITFFPNPAQEEVFINTGNISNISGMIVRNNLGVVVYQDTKDIQNGYRFDLTNLASGIYYAELKSTDGISVIKKFVKQ